MCDGRALVISCMYQALINCARARDPKWSRDLPAILAGSRRLCVLKFSKQEKTEAAFCEDLGAFSRQVRHRTTLKGKLSRVNK